MMDVVIIGNIHLFSKFFLEYTIDTLETIDLKRGSFLGRFRIYDVKKNIKDKP